MSVCMCPDQQWFGMVVICTGKVVIGHQTLWCGQTAPQCVCVCYHMHVNLKSFVLLICNLMCVCVCAQVMGVSSLPSLSASSSWRCWECSTFTGTVALSPGPFPGLSLDPFPGFQLMCPQAHSQVFTVWHWKAGNGLGDKVVSFLVCPVYNGIALSCSKLIVQGLYCRQEVCFTHMLSHDML